MHASIFLVKTIFTYVKEIFLTKAFQMFTVSVSILKQLGKVTTTLHLIYFIYRKNRLEMIFVVNWLTSILLVSIIGEQVNENSYCLHLKYKYIP